MKAEDVLKLCKVETLAATMSEHRVRHLPIISKGELLGLLSMRDVVVVQAQVDQAEIRCLKDYINGQYPH